MYFGAEHQNFWIYLVFNWLLTYPNSSPVCMVMLTAFIVVEPWTSLQSIENTFTSSLSKISVKRKHTITLGVTQMKQLRNYLTKPVHLTIDYITLRNVGIVNSVTIFCWISNWTIISPSWTIEFHIGIRVVIRFLESIQIIQEESLKLSRVFSAINIKNLLFRWLIPR